MFDPAMFYEPATYWEQMDEDDFDHLIKKANRRAKVDRISKAKEEFMKVNGQKLKSTILPILNEQTKEARKRRE